jgi:hypothetical protein
LQCGEARHKKFINQITIQSWLNAIFFIRPNVLRFNNR